MPKIYIIKILRHFKDYSEIDVEDRYFSSEEEAKKYLINKDGQWIDEERLFIYYSGLWRFKKRDETGISFHIRPIKAA